MSSAAEKYGTVKWRNMIRCVPPGNMISPPAANLIVGNQKKYEAAGVSQFIREREGEYCSILAHCHSAGCHYQVTRDCFSTKSPTFCLSWIIFSFPWISILSSLDFYFAFRESLFFWAANCYIVTSRQRFLDKPTHPGQKPVLNLGSVHCMRRPLLLAGFC